MTRSRAKLAVVPDAPAPVMEATEMALRTLLRDRDRAEREIAEIDAIMLAYRKRYAAESGEFLLPSIERLRRELL